jgi:hypothetical protein
MAQPDLFRIMPVLRSLSPPTTIVNTLLSNKWNLIPGIWSFLRAHLKEGPYNGIDCRASLAMTCKKTVDSPKDHAIAMLMQRRYGPLTIARRADQRLQPHVLPAVTRQ